MATPKQNPIVFPGVEILSQVGYQVVVLLDANADESLQHILLHTLGITPVIDAEETVWGIWIENSSVYFRIENCSIYNSGSIYYAQSNWHWGGGILLSYVKNSQLINNNCSFNYQGIFLEYSSNNTISGNIANNNHYGIMIRYSTNNSVSETIAINNQVSGIYLILFSNNNTISGNIATNNGNETGL